MSTDRAAGTPLDGRTVDADNPWPGLLSFREADQPYFQGRGSEIEDLRRLVMRETLTVLFGLSGLGKSSLLQAGLFPVLRQEQVFPVYIRFDFAAEPLDLVSQVREAIARQAESAEIEAPASGASDTLWEFFHRRDADFWNARNRPVVPLLVFDQFEEIFTLGRSGAARARATEGFLDQLSDLTAGRPPTTVKARLDAHPEEAATFSFARHHYKILLSLREDFLPDLEALRPRFSAVALNRLRLRRLNGEAALGVVGQAPHLIEPAVANQIVRFVAAQPDDVPLTELEVEPALLSVVCRELNNRRRRLGEPTITAALLEGSQEQVLADFYERSMADLGPAVRSFVEERLLTLSGYRDSVALENALSAPGLTRDAIERLVERRLLRIEDRGDVERVELTHDLLTGVIRASRDRRRRLEALDQERVARTAAQQREQDALTQLRRSRRMATAFLVLAIAAVAAAAWAMRAQIEARRQRQIAIVHRADAEQASKNAEGARARAESSLAAEQTARVAARQAESEARARAAEAAEQREVANEETRRARVALAHTIVQDAQRLAEANRPDQALAQLARALRVDPQSVAARTWIADLLRRGWWVPSEAVHHDGSIAALSPDGHRVATVTDGSTVRVRTETGAAVGAAIPLQQRYAPVVVVFSPNGRQMLIRLPDETAGSIWDAESGQIGPPLQTGFAISAAFSPDGHRLVTASLEKTAQVWDTSTGNPVGKPLHHDERVVSALFSPDGHRVITASFDSTAKVWNAESGELLLTLRHDDGMVMSAAFSSDARHVVTAAGNKARLWDANTGRPVGEPMVHSTVVRDAVFSSDTRLVLTIADEDRAARVWSAETSLLLQTLLHDRQVQRAEFSPDGHQVLTVAADNAVRVWNTDTGAAAQPMRHADPLVAAAFTADGRSVRTVSNNTVRVWIAGAAESGETLFRHGARVVSAAFSSGARYALTISETYDTLTAWDTTPSAPGGRGRAIGVPIRSPERVVRATISADGHRIVTIDGEDQAPVWDVRTGRVIHKLPHHDEVNSAAFSSDDSRIVTTSQDETARIWDARTGRLLRELRGHEPMFSAVFSFDSRRVVTGSEGGNAQVWDTLTGQLLRELRQDTSVDSVTFSPDGRQVVTVSQDRKDNRTVRLWDASSGNPLQELHHEQAVHSAAFSPDSRRVVTASGNTARIWETDTGRLLGEPLRHDPYVLNAAFDADGTHVITASGETARRWEVLIPTASAAETRHLAGLAEAVGGYRVNEFGSLMPVQAQEQMIDSLRQLGRAARGESSLASFCRRFLGSPR